MEVEWFALRQSPLGGIPDKRGLCYTQGCYSNIGFLGNWENCKVTNGTQGSMRFSGLVKKYGKHGRKKMEWMRL
jgi:hypothetical protein